MRLTFVNPRNIFSFTEYDALVNPVNCVGVMGAGLAKQFAERYPEILRPYRDVCSTGRFNAGQTILFPSKGKQIACLSTKNHWKDPSEIEWIESGMRSLLDTIGRRSFSSIVVPYLVAIPAIGCGLGGLHWGEVKGIICKVCDDEKYHNYNIQATVVLPTS